VGMRSQNIVVLLQFFLFCFNRIFFQKMMGMQCTPFHQTVPADDSHLHAGKIILWPDSFFFHFCIWPSFFVLHMTLFEVGLFSVYCLQRSSNVIILLHTLREMILSLRMMMMMKTMTKMRMTKMMMWRVC
jgi:hypothetical protein